MPEILLGLAILIVLGFILDRYVQAHQRVRANNRYLVRFAGGLLDRQSRRVANLSDTISYQDEVYMHTFGNGSKTDPAVYAFQGHVTADDPKFSQQLR